MDRKGKDLRKTEKIKRWQKYTEELYKKKGLNNLDNHNSVVTHLELDILEYEVKWALGSITTNKGSRSNKIPAELFKILKDDALKCCTQHVIILEISVVATGLEKVSLHSKPKVG